MEVLFEVGRKNPQGMVAKQPSAEKKEVVAKTPTKSKPSKEEVEAEKKRLHAILDEAGVSYTKTLGVPKLQALVDEIQPAKVDPIIETKEDTEQIAESDAGSPVE